jgi:hypothetical protein
MARDVREETADVLKALSRSEEKVMRMRFGIGYDRNTRCRKSPRSSASLASGSAKSKTKGPSEIA